MNEFNLTYYTRRWNAPTTLTVVKTTTGWHISHIAIYGDTDKDGAPVLKANFNQDYVKYPHNVGGFLSFIWGQLHNNEIDQERAQDMFDEVGEWISVCEKSQPDWRGWNC